MGQATGAQRSIPELAKNHMISDRQLDAASIYPKIYLTANEVDDVYNRIINSETRINYNGQFTTAILNDGYKHWSQLESSRNTSSTELFIERLSSESELFNMKSYNSNMIRRASDLFLKDKEKFIENWNKRFCTNFSVDDTNDVEKMFVDTGFTCNPKGEEVIFGCLYHDNNLINTAKLVDQKYIESTYGKSQIVLKKDYLKGKTTCCLGDTFDADPSSYAWKNSSALEKKHVLFELSSEENVRNRLKSCPKDSIPYIENHIFSRVTSEHMEKIILDRKEFEKCYPDAAEAAAKKRELEELYLHQGP